MNTLTHPGYAVPFRPSQSERPPMTDAARLESLARLRPDFLRFALLQVRDADVAEDLVQETLEAALKGLASFGGQSSLKTWVFGILKHKIVDHLRRKDRAVLFSELVGDAAESDEVLDHLFNARGLWNVEARPEDWNGPEAALESTEFWRVFDACLNRLPENLSRVFMMREFLGFEASEICDQLQLTTTNCHVILHRARTRLRVCLEGNWFQTEKSDA